jgi:hypothetical protein
VNVPLFLLLALGLVGCRHSVPLTNEKASDLARSLANAKAQELYACQPFNDGPTARFDKGLWVWHDQRGRGLVDYEATVELAADGTVKRVDVDLLSTQPLLPTQPRSSF